jgi:hypothetical protein
VYNCERWQVKDGSDPTSFKVSVDGSHSEQLETGRIDISGRLYRTSELAIYAKLLLANGNWNHGGI